jgi:hypothetical protein
MNQNFNASIEPFSVRRFEGGELAGNHLIWVAEAFGRTVGSATVTHNDPSVAHLRSLCVAPDFASPPAVAKALAETAIREVYERGYLKLVVHTDLLSGRLTPALHNLGFEFSREHLIDGERVVEFYRNLYERPQLSLAFAGEQLGRTEGDGNYD